MPCDVIVIFYGQQISHCEDDVRLFLNSTGCYRVGGYLSLDSNITELLPDIKNILAVIIVHDYVSVPQMGVMNPLNHLR